MNKVTGDLDYYSSQSSATPSGTIRIADIYRIRRFDELSFQIEASTSSVLLRGESQAELACWIDLLSTYVEDVRKYERVNHAKSAEDAERAIRK